VVGAPSAVHSAVVDHGELMAPVAAEFVDGGRRRRSVWQASMLCQRQQSSI